jgi:ketosteroid isomerase-like protein
MANTDLVAKMYQYVHEGNMDGIRSEVFHPNMSWTMPGHHPLSGRMEGVDAVLSFFGALFQAGINVTDLQLGQLGDGTVIENHLGHGSINGEEFLFPTCTTYRLKDGKIHEVRVHTGDQHTVDRYMWTVFKLKGIPARLDQS